MTATKLSLTLLFLFVTHSASSFSISFDQSNYSAANGSQITVTINYDFTDQTVASIGADLYYDSTVLELVSYVPASSVSPISTITGSLEAPGQYANFGISTEFFNGISNAATLGTFTFNVLSDVATPNTVCGNDLCLTSAEFLPVVSITGEDISDLVFAGQDGLSANVTQVPLPASVWLLLSALGVISSTCRK